LLLFVVILDTKVQRSNVLTMFSGLVSFREKVLQKIIFQCQVDSDKNKAEITNIFPSYLLYA